MKISIVFIPEVEFNSDKNVSKQPMQAVYLLGEILLRKGFNVEIIDQSSLNHLNINNFEEIDSKIVKGAEIVLFSSNSFNWGNTKAVMAAIKNNRAEIKTVVGGIHATMMDEYIASLKIADVIIRGEGEIILPLVVEALVNKSFSMLKKIKGITYIYENTVVRNEDSELLTSEEYNYYNSFSPFEKLPAMIYDAIPCETSRGCMYNCCFCGVGIHRSWKTLTTENLLKKISETAEIVRTKTNNGFITLTDDCFTANKERMLDTLNFINDLPYRPDLVLEGRLNEIQSPEVMDAIRQNNIRRFLVGIECGYDEGLKRVRKGYKTAQIESYLQNTKKAGISEKLYCSFIMGLPWETVDDCIETIKFAAKIVEKYGVRSNISTWSIIPSELWNMRKEYGIYLNDDYFDDQNWFINSKDRKMFQLTHPLIGEKENEKLAKILDMYYRRGIKLADNYLKSSELMSF